MNNSGTKLPNISNNKSRPPRKNSQLDRTRSKTQFSEVSSQRSQNNTFSGQNWGTRRLPFKVPVENEVFEFQEEERRRKHEQKILVQNQKIWEKTTKTSGNPLKQPKNFQVPIYKNHQTKLTYNTKQKRSITQALDIVKQRSLTKDQPQQKMVVNQVIEQKKEMFLVTMTHDIVEKEIAKLQKITNEKETALELSKNMLKADEEEFNKYLEKNKKDRADAERKEDIAVKERQAKEREIKQLLQQLTVYKHQIDRLNEDIHNFTQNKLFLDKLAPKEFLEERKQNINNKITMIEDDWITDNLGSLDQIKLWQNECKSKAIKEIDIEKGCTYKEKQKIFDELIQLNKIQEIVQYCDEYREPFTKTSELKEVFDHLEQKNLFKMQEFQSLQQQFEESVQQFKQNQQIMEPKIQNLKDQKENMKRELELINEEIEQIKKKQHINQDSTNDFKILHKIIYNKLFENEENVFNIQDPQTLDPKSLLTHIELQLEKQIKEFKKYDRKLVEKHRHKAITKRKDHNRMLKGIELEEEQKLKFQKNLEKVLKPIHKRTGRIPMVKSKTDKKQKIVKQKIDTTIDETEKYLDPNFVFGIDKPQAKKPQTNQQNII